MAEYAQGASGDRACGFLPSNLGVVPREDDFALSAADFGATAWAEEADGEEDSDEEEISVPLPLAGFFPQSTSFA